jgi:hypothetical protein
MPAEFQPGGRKRSLYPWLVTEKVVESEVFQLEMVRRMCTVGADDPILGKYSLIFPSIFRPLRTARCSPPSPFLATAPSASLTSPLLPSRPFCFSHVPSAPLTPPLLLSRPLCFSHRS